MQLHLPIELVGSFLVFQLFALFFAWAGQNYDLRIGSKGVRGFVSALTSIQLTNHLPQLNTWHKVSAAFNAFLLRAPFRPFLKNVWDTLRVYGELKIRIEGLRVFIFDQRGGLREYPRVPLDPSDIDNRFNVSWRPDDDALQGAIRNEIVTLTYQIDLTSFRRNVRHLMRAHHEIINTINFFVLVGFAHRYDGQYIFGLASFNTNCWILFLSLMTDGALYWLITARPLQLPHNLGKHLVAIYTVACINPINTRMILDSYPQAMCRVTSVEQLPPSYSPTFEITNDFENHGELYRCATNQTTNPPIVSFPLVSARPDGNGFDFLACILTVFRLLSIVPEYVFMVNSGLHKVTHLIAASSGVLIAFNVTVMEDLQHDHFVYFGAFYFAASCINETCTPSRNFFGGITQFLQVMFSFAMVTTLFLA